MAELKRFSDRKDWSEKQILDPNTGYYRSRYFFKGEQAQRIPLTSRLARQLGGYALIERDLRMVQEWLYQIYALSKDQINQGKEGWALTEKSDSEHNRTLGLFVAAVTFYGKCFTECEGRRVKLERDIITDELRGIHDDVMSFRNNLTAHSGAKKYEDVQVVLVLNPDRAGRDEKKFLIRELIQTEAWVSLDPSEPGFLKLVDGVRTSVLEKLEEINNKIFADEINPKGLDYWYSQRQY